MNDEELGRAFAELKQHDRRQAPAFAAVMERARRRPMRGALMRVRLAAAIAVLAIVGATLLLGRPHIGPVVAIADWRAPTDVLLRVPGAALDSLPDVTASLSRAITITTTTSSPRPVHSRRDTT